MTRSHLKPEGCQWFILESTFEIDNEVFELILPVTSSIDLPDADNMRRALNSLIKDVGKKYKEAQDYEEWMSQTYLSELFSRFYAEFNEETLFKMQEDY
ncbi:26727_t:CDS:2 [Dentiscutata erythropus]|uniref:26727_t:CDS:1 n=1 Tax=Dentiscutata erythropus TaxID=1348616 RepID=A0A9N9IN66_9GLOM|nr:26727_t:CDS:2 [Dentiscutata erythropus]